MSGVGGAIRALVFGPRCYGVSEDGKAALKWFTLSAEQGNREAQYFVGTIYYNGLDVPKDLKKALPNRNQSKQINGLFVGIHKKR